MSKIGSALASIVILVGFSGCNKSSVPTGPSQPQVTSLNVTSYSPPSGSTIVIPAQYPYNQVGGVVLPAGSGVITVSGTLSLAQDEAYAQLNIYLLTGSGATYCGQNLPDSPVWYNLKSGWTANFSISGWQIYNLPNDVTGLRVMLHRRQSGNLTPPTDGQTIVETTIPVSWKIQR